MNKYVMVIVFFGVFLAGCEKRNPTFPLRSQLHLGMAIEDVWKLYGLRIEDSNTIRLIPDFALIPASETMVENCEQATYRHLLEDNSKKVPFLLTFKRCRMSNYDDVQKEKERRVSSFKENADPNIKKELNEFSKKYKLGPENEEVLIELLAGESALPQCMTSYTLVNIKPENYKSNNKKQSKVKSQPFTLEQLRLGMTKSEVESICQGSMEFISSRVLPDNSIEKIYRMWPNETKGLFGAGTTVTHSSLASNIWARGKDLRPYYLAFAESDNPELILKGFTLDVETTRHIEMQQAEITRRLQGQSRSHQPATSYTGQITVDNDSVITPDGYGLGVHRNQYGQAVTLEPDFGGVPGEELQIKTNAYGPGVHADQYGRPVRERQWP